MTAPPSSPVERVADAAGGPGSAVAFGALSALRRRRIFHPTGTAYSATVDIDPADQLGVPLFDERARRRAIIRLSRGAGVPAPLPDVLGLAVRILDAHGAGDDQDLLMVSSGTAPGLRHALLPARKYGDAFYSSILPLRVAGRAVLVGAQATRSEEESPSIFDLVCASPLGPWQPLGRIEVGLRLPDQQAEALQFNPFVTGGGIEPAGVLNALRRRAYAGSQGGRTLFR